MDQREYKVERSVPRDGQRVFAISSADLRERDSAFISAMSASVRIKDCDESESFRAIGARDDLSKDDASDEFGGYYGEGE